MELAAIGIRASFHFTPNNISEMTPYHQSFERLQHILNELRTKCPWDQKQTVHSLKTQTIEELYELVDAIAVEDWHSIKEELGDLLLHLLFYSKIATEQGRFDIGDVIENICNKLVRRHPHIYTKLEVEDDTVVKQNWEKLKLKEGRKSVLSGVPQSLPALVKAFRLQDKAKQVGFEWDTTAQVAAKVKEEWNELQEALQHNNSDAIEDEFGDVLFSMVNYARFIGVDPESALERTNKKFKLRFEHIEKIAAEKDLILHDMSLEEMDTLWNLAKKII